MDIEIIDTLEAIAKTRPDLCEYDGRNFTLRFPDGSQPLQIDTGIDGDKEDGEGYSDFAIVTGWALQILHTGLSEITDATIRIDTDDDEGMEIYRVSTSMLGIGRIGESEIFEYAVLDCLKQCLEPDAFSLKGFVSPEVNK